jgi:methionyl-tRNA formyltransferase
MRVLFAGSADIALPCLERLIDSGSLVGVLTNPDCPQGRGRIECSTSIASLAAAKAPGIPLLKPEKLDQSARDAVSALKPDLLAVFAYGKIFGPKFLALFPSGGINVHPSLLPLLRGSSPIPAAILSLARETGISVQRLALRMDSGDILARRHIPLNGRETTASLSLEVSRLSAGLMERVISDIDSGAERAEAQDESRASYCGFIKKEDGKIDWKDGAPQIDARVRAFDPWPLAYTGFKGLRLSILESLPLPEESREEAGKVLALDRKRGILIQTGKGVLAVTRLQLEKKKALAYMDFLNGSRDFIGSTLQ